MASDQSPLTAADGAMGVDVIPALGMPDRRIDAEVHRRYRAFTVELRSGPISEGLPVPQYTNSLDAVIDLAHDLLPGWTYGVSTGPLADDVRLTPSEQTYPIVDGSAEVAGLEVSLAPAPRAAINLLAALIETKTALEEQRAPQPDVPAARELFATATAVREPLRNKSTKATKD